MTADETAAAVPTTDTPAPAIDAAVTTDAAPSVDEQIGTDATAPVVEAPQEAPEAAPAEAPVVEAPAVTAPAAEAIAAIKAQTPEGHEDCGVIAEIEADLAKAEAWIAAWFAAHA